MTDVDGETVGYRYRKFVRHLRKKNRFVLSTELNAWISGLSGWCKNNKLRKLPIGAIYYRSRINEPFLNDPYKPRYMLAPPPNVVKQGRANPIGIPYLYLAKDELTAIAEVRAWVGAKVSVAPIVTTEVLEIMDYEFNGVDNHKDEEIRFILEAAFARPIDRLESDA
jgi:hypothetical protein